jgi:histidyl-tRNA synthetase
LVRGLDYYLRTVFEVISPELGEDTVICGGGRYDRLISDLGGKPVPGVGFAIGEDRLIEILPESFATRVLAERVVTVLPVGDRTVGPATRLARDLVRAGVAVHTEVTGRSLKACLKWSGKMDATAAVILGEEELAEGVAVVRDLRRGEQETVTLDAVVATVIGLLEKMSDTKTEQK